MLIRLEIGFLLVLNQVDALWSIGAPTPGAKSGLRSAGNVVADLWDGKDGPRIKQICEKCADEVIYEDLSLGTVHGADAVEELLRKKFPRGSRLFIERIAGGDEISGGFTWHRGDENTIGLRGTLFAQMNENDELVYVREASEPLFKPGEFTEKLLKAATKNIQKEIKIPTFQPAKPTTASGIVEYLWKEAYPKGATTEIALDFFDENIIYEDFNYPQPILGKSNLATFLDAFDIPGIESFPLRISQGGGDACVFTWEVKVNGAQGPQGISFYQISKLTKKPPYVRDIPASAPAPLQRIAAVLNPKLRVFSSPDVNTPAAVAPPPPP